MIVRRRRRYFLNSSAAVFAIAVHAIFAALLLYNFNWKSEVIQPRAPQKEQPLKAKIVSEQEIQDQLTIIKQQQNQKIKQERDRKKRMDDMLKQTRDAEQKRQQEQQRLVELKRKNDQQKKKLKQQQKKRKLEQQRLAKIKEQQAKKQRVLEEQHQRERDQREAQIKARIEGEQEKREASTELNKFAHLISEKVRRNWNQPSISGARIKPTVLVRFSVSGEVLSVRVTRSSGSEVMDRSVENAVRKASPLPIPTNPKYYKHYQDGVEFVFDPGDFKFS